MPPRVDQRSVCPEQRTSETGLRPARADTARLSAKARALVYAVFLNCTAISYLPLLRGRERTTSQK